MCAAASNPTWGVALLSGGVAGTAVDVTLYPLDTIKTRLQSSQGFVKAGGFRNIYAGLGPAALGSAPNAALFFCTYEITKSVLSPVATSEASQSLVHMLAASLGEVTACLVRVPVEVIKQRRQANSKGASSLTLFNNVLKNEGFKGLYRGYLTTVFREIPFSFLQFPLWEFLKSRWASSQKEQLKPWQSSCCGAVAGAISAAVTTPLDVAKTRIMLADSNSEIANRAGTVFTLREVFKNQGMKGLFSGVVPRVLWISIGGAVFFGVYEEGKILFAT